MSVTIYFRDLGRKRANFSVEVPELCFHQLYCAVRPHLLSRDIDFTEDGFVLAGFRAVGRWSTANPDAVEDVATLQGLGFPPRAAESGSARAEPSPASEDGLKVTWRPTPARGDAANSNAQREYGVQETGP